MTRHTPPGHTPLASLRLLAPLSFHERGMDWNKKGRSLSEWSGSVGPAILSAGGMCRTIRQARFGESY